MNGDSTTRPLPKIDSWALFLPRDNVRGVTRFAEGSMVPLSASSTRHESHNGKNIDQHREIM